MLRPRHWILLRGLARESAHWGGFPDVLLQQLIDAGLPKDTKVHGLDLPGSGEFYLQSSPSRVAEICAQVRKSWAVKAEQAGISPAEPVAVVAVSLGAMVGLEWVRQAPEQVALAVLMNTSLRGLSPPHHRLRLEMWRQFLRSVATRDPVERERRVLKIISHRLEVHEQVAREWGQIYLKHPFRRLNVLKQVMAASRFRIETWDHPHPILLLSGLGDRMVDPSCSQAIHKEFGWPLVQHPWAGHDLTLDDGPWVAEQISKWLAAMQ